MSFLVESKLVASPAEQPIRSLPVTGLAGQFQMPGDKSISHRALMFGAIARGETVISGLLEGDDVMRTAAAMRAIGGDVEVEDRRGERVWTVIGRPNNLSVQEPVRLYFGNAGTGARLAMGLIAGLGLAARFDGDASLRARPMGRILEPLRLMGLEANDHEGKLPIELAGNYPLFGISYTLPVASAQIKSAILLAGLHAKGTTTIIEPERSRDHTENMLRAFGVEISCTAHGEGQIIRLDGGQTLSGCAVEVPGDPSSAAFLMVAALITPGASVTLTNILLNPMRTGLIKTLQEMGGRIDITKERTCGGERVGDLSVRHSQLRGIKVPAQRAPSMIDEYPILAVAAAFAEGQTEMTGIGEMRVKESDRIAATEAGLRANGVETASGPDWLRVTGSKKPRGGGHVVTYHDHRIAMSFLVMGCASQQPVSIDSTAMIETSFPTFIDMMRNFGAAFERAIFN